MKILLITDLYPIKIEEEATPRTLHNFVMEWMKQGNSVDVIKPNFVFNSFLRKKPFYKTKFYKYEGVKVFNANYFTPFWFNFLNKIPKEFNLSNYDVVIAHMPSGIIFANKLVKIIKKPLVCGVHFSDIEVLTNPIYKFYFKNQLEDAYKNAKKIACRSLVLQNEFCKLFPELAEKTFIANSGIAVESDKLPSRTFSPPLKVLTCANLIKRKNIDKLVSIKQLCGFELTIIGDGKELQNLKKIYGKSANFLGRLPHEQVLEEMRKSDIFILPSVNETFGMVYLEAMASGCITVCTKGDGIDGIIKDSENGFLTEPTVEGIKHVLLKIKEFKDKDIIIKNAVDAVKSFTPDVCAKNYLENL